MHGPSRNAVCHVVGFRFEACLFIHADGSLKKTDGSLPAIARNFVLGLAPSSDSACDAVSARSRLEAMKQQVRVRLATVRLHRAGLATLMMNFFRMRRDALVNQAHVIL